MKWSELKSIGQIDQIREESKQSPILIFKYSSRCSISRMALDRLERNWIEGEMIGVKPYFLDLITYREISNRIAHVFNVEHESPQVLIIENEKAIYDQSHMAIDYQSIKEIVHT
ncbi:bacillithiol system redox-active protein YtxJ [Chryseolinea sp. H1M3-3]|uniref:bacillithiol system redox-active protein YtxJ n=1 Tax=Chryseolinea sp. H1M3-3 TaxID=3034144 RepID=UPI0023EDEC05|nr:bacillithiol system redox-active protein YtxJ [Chryseolinea sp. H1M3-3]